MSEENSPSPAAEEPKQTPEELTQGSEELTAGTGGDELEAAAEPEPEAAADTEAIGEIEELAAAMLPDLGADDEDAADAAADADAEEDALAGLLRDRLHQAVAPIEPKPGTLDYLHHAVPARRKRRQTALTTTAVTVFAVGTAVTLASHGALGGDGGSSDNGANVGNSYSTTAGNVNGGGGSRGTGIGSPGHTPIPAYATTPATAPVQPSHSESFATPPLGSATVPPNLPNCQNSSMSSVVPTAGPIANGVSYETMTATALTACTITGPPLLTVLDAAGTISSKVPVFKADGVAAPGLAAVRTWGQTLVLKPGDKYEFQFAWVDTPCAPPTTPTSSVPSSVPSSTPPSSSSPSAPGASSPAGSAPTTPTGTPTSAPSPSQSPSTPSPSSFTVAYSVYGTQPIANANFSATCGAAVYVTDIFQAGAYPGPRSGAAATQNPTPKA